LFHTHSTGRTNCGSALTCASCNTYLSITFLSYTYTHTYTHIHRHRTRRTRCIRAVCCQSYHPSCHAHQSVVSLSLRHTHTALRTLVLLAACPVSGARRHATHTIQSCHTLSLYNRVTLSLYTIVSHSHILYSRVTLYLSHTHTALGALYSLAACPVSHATHHATHTNKSCLFHTHTHTQRQGWWVW